MKTLKNTCLGGGRSFPRLLTGLVLLFACWSFTTPAAHAQAYKDIQTIVPTDPTVVVPVTEVTPLAELSSRDLSGMSAAWWKNIRKEHVRLLRSSDEQLKRLALRNVIFFAKMYPDQVDLTRATSRLLKIYRYDANEGLRIMALAALYVIGDDRAMEQVRKYVSEEKSERVRRHTLLGLADYYKNRGAQ